MKIKNKIYLIYEYYSNAKRLINKIIEEKTLDVNLARSIFQQIIVNIYFFHKYNIYHSNINLDNILIDNNNNIKIYNYELKYILNDEKKNLLFIQNSESLNFCSPEELKSDNFNRFYKDVWSSCVVLYVMITGKYPYDESGYIKKIKNIIKCEYLDSEYLKNDIKDFMLKIFNKKLENRYKIDDIINDSWFKNNFDKKMIEFEIDNDILNNIKSEMVIEEKNMNFVKK